MPEWTGQIRDELYELLGEGRLEQARELVGKFIDLKRNDLKPVDKRAMAELSCLIEHDEQLQRLATAMLYDGRRSVWLMTRLCFQHFEAFSGDILAQAFDHIVEPLCKKIPLSMMITPYLSGWTADNERLADYVTFMLEFPTTAALASLTNHCSHIDNWIITRKQQETRAQLVEQAKGQTWQGVVKRASVKKKQDSSQPSASKTKKKTRAQAQPEPLTHEQRNALIQELFAYLEPQFNPNYNGITAGHMQRIRKACAALAKDLEVESFVQFDGFSPPVVAHVIVQEYTKALIREHSRPKVLCAFDGLVQRLLAEPQNNRERTYGIREDVLKGADQLDPLFAISRRNEWRPSICYHTHPGDFDVKTLRDKPVSEIRDFLSRWEVSTIRGNQSYNRSTWQMDGIRMFLDQPEYSDIIAARLVTCLESSSAMEIDWAFRLAFEDPRRVGADALRLHHLAARGLWQLKTIDAVKAVHRIHALAEFDRCEPDQAAEQLEQAFTIEEPMLWRAAAEAIRTLQKKDPDLKLINPDRVREIMQRDPVKFGKFIAPILPKE